ncbi:Zn(II)2Cys6 transcription factor [Aspergillus mulundensis]|uniref:Putative C6 zinc finger protein n=1 Tax=Aspergillus mulundensis TaxID=1810919 RepID=A0A3D8T4B1_9EURO|nr:putative C6 zinc finger protein [Aspergillus mulundensis]RDW93397.1 putative C6 zinc finger protein [Aspergillus mulundensis]
MRPSLRRACAACAKYKASCDLGTPRCSRCIKRRVECVYANQPLPSTQAPSRAPAGQSQCRPLSIPPFEQVAKINDRFGSVDPFESYPPTRLPRTHVQRLIHSFLHKIAFEYYPLDLSATSNPFLVSWWPLALGDPALFHVSLQTACLDEELLAQKGFHASEILMADSVALLRRKVLYPSLAVQDGTMNSVITLAAIEFGKGNILTSQMHVDGVKRLVGMRGGINAVRQTSPLTARMISWVSMLVMGHPQFPTQDDQGIGDGIPLVPEWQVDLMSSSHPINNPDLLGVLDLTTDPQVRGVLIRLRAAFDRAQQAPLSSTRLHDLTCFVIHRLLLSAPDATGLAVPESPITESIRYAVILYMFIIHGPTYYSHAVIMGSVVARLVNALAHLDDSPRAQEYVLLDVWITAIGLVASANTPHTLWFAKKAQSLVESLQLQSWDDVLLHLRGVLWLETGHCEQIFRLYWDPVLAAIPAYQGPEANLVDMSIPLTWAPLGRLRVES